MKVARKGPEPVLLPPTTYDIIGLTLEEATALRDLVGRFSCYGTHWHTSLYRALSNVLQGRLENHFTATITAELGPPKDIQTLQCKKLEP